MKRLLLTLAVLAAVALLAGEVLLRRAASTPAVRAWGERIASEALDLEVSFDGEIRPFLGIPLGLRLTEVRAAMLEGEERRERLGSHFDVLEIGFDPRPLLFGGETEITRIYARGGEIDFADPVVPVLEAYFGSAGPGSSPADEADRLVPPLRFEDVVVEFPTELGGRGRLELTELRAVEEEELLAMAGEWQGQPFSMRASVRVILADRMVLEELTASLAEDGFSGSLGVDLEGARPRIEGRLRSDGLRPTRLLERLGTGSAGGSPFDEPIPIGSLESLDARFELELSRMELPGMKPVSFAGTLTLEDGALEVVAHRLELFGGGGHASFAARPEDGLTRAALSGEVRGLEVEQILAREGSVAAVDGDLDIELFLQGAGASPRELLGRSSGSVHVDMGRTLLRDDRIGLLGKTPLALLVSFVQEQQELVLNCAVAHVELIDGLGPMDSLVDTPEATLRGSGGLSLKEMQMDHLVRTRRKHAGVGALKAPIRVSGPLNDLEVETDTGEMVRQTGEALLLGVFKPSLIIVPFVDLGSKDKNPCLAALETDRIPEELPRKGLLEGMQELVPHQMRRSVAR